MRYLLYRNLTDVRSSYEFPIPEFPRETTGKKSEGSFVKKYKVCSSDMFPDISEWI